MSRAACRIDGCEKESRGRGLCATHWARWRKHGDPLVVKKAGVDFNVATRCKVDGCDRTVKAQSFCQKHYDRARKHGDPLHVEPITGRPLVGEFPTWAAIHKRLDRTRGKARAQSCVDCGGTAAEWSYDNADPGELVGKVGRFEMRYSLDLSHYIPRCTPCHRLFDMAAAS